MKSTRKHCLGCLLGIVILTAILLSGCTQPQTVPANPTPSATTVAATPTPVVHSPNTLLIATTTSLYDTGLLNAVQDLYENQTGIHLKITSQGTGIAIQVATRGDCDLLLVHSPSQEKAFIDKGLGVNQRCFAYNYFEIVGPASDPAGIANLTPEAAFTKIRTLGLNNTPGVFFASRGDQSGTHSAEQNIWKGAGFNYTRDVATSGSWYLSLGKGMGETLTVAGQKGAYTLTDEGTFLAFKSQLNLVPLITKGTSLLNRYSAIAVNHSVNSNVNIVQADRFINWLVSDEGRQFVGNYGVEKYGKSLFTPLTPDGCTKAPFNCTCSGDVSPI
ncbi:MAG TPA: substrate-binding domain-containing protein [Methanomicrobiales archaeon]|nr:substrate-binding domain-containing protein [Methanomicrobiales archaeon]